MSTVRVSPAPRPRPAGAACALVRSALSAGLALTCGFSQAQEQGATPTGLRITPSVDVDGNYVETSRPATPGQASERVGDFVAQIRPGVRMAARLGRTQAALSYSLSATQHSRKGLGTTFQNNLNATLRTELIERWLFLDADASITQQAISAYGQQSADNLQINSNRTEVSQISLRPSSRGSLAGLAIYDINLNVNANHVKDSQSPDSRSASGSASLSSVSGAALLGWRLGATQQHSSFSGGQSSDSTRTSASLLVRPNQELNGSLRAGQETTRIGSFYDTTYKNWGGDLRWTPSPRTTASASADRRYFGNGYAVALDHRLARAAVHFTSTRDVNNGSNGQGVGQPVTLYQLFYSQFASLQPDPVQREQLVRSFLLAIGQDPNGVVSGGYVNVGVTVQRRDDLSFSYLNSRTTVTLQAFRSQSRRLEGSTTAGGLPFDDVDQTGFISGLNYRLTPSATVSLTGSRLRTKGTSTQAGNQLNSAVLSWSDRVSRLVTTSINARYSVFDGPINPYREIGLGATLGLHF